MIEIDNAVEKLVLTEIKISLNNILVEYQETGLIDQTIEHEIIRIDYRLKKLDQTRIMKLKSSMIKIDPNILDEK